MDSRKETLPYFMSYGTEEKQFDKDERKRDRDYFRQIYSSEIKTYLRLVSEAVDVIGGRESFIFHEYPDKIRLEQLTEQILDKLPVQNKVPRESQRQIIKILLYNEIYIRRNKL